MIRLPLAAAALVALVIAVSACDAGPAEPETTTIRIGEGARAGPEGTRTGGGDGGAPSRAARDLPGDCPNERIEPARGEARALARSAFCLVNAVRAHRGLPQLERNPSLADAAVIHSRDMDRDNYFAHVSPDGTDLIGWVRGTGYLEGKGSYRLAENIAFGTGSAGTPAEIVAGWMSSASHRENILDRRLSEAGMGVVIGAPSRNPPATGAIYTQIFGG